MFAKGTGPGRRSVVVESSGLRMVVIQVKADGPSSKSEKQLSSDAEVRSASELMARELTARGFVEQVTPGSSQGMPVAPLVAAPRSARQKAEPEPPADDLYRLEEIEESAQPAPVLPRLAPPPESEAKTKKPDRKKKKKGEKPGGGDELDRRVLAGAGAAGAVMMGLVGFFVYDAFLKPPTLVGIWQGSRLEYETGGPMSYLQYRLVLDDQKHAALTLQGDMNSSGTYELKGDRLVLALKDHDEPAAPVPAAEGDDAEGGAGAEAGPVESRSDVQEYKIALGRATLDLYDVRSGKKVVQLVRQREKPAIGGGGAASSAAPARGPTAPEVGAGDPAADSRLASVEFSPKDQAFKVKYPPGWEVETGSRPDNTYSWGRFTQGGAKIQVFADVAGSLMAGQSTGDQPRGSEFAPVHRAHELYKKTIADEFSEYHESPPTLFEGAGLGEGRIAGFKASEGGVLGGKVEGYRITLLSNDRRITVLCQSPGRDLAKWKPTFLAVARSVSR